MADKLDPHHLVALMSYLFRGREDGSSSRYLDLTFVNPGNGITNNRETSIRTFPILDAIANICVFKKGSQPVAVALQLKPKELEIRLTIAEDQEVEPLVVNHLNSVWEKLQALSDGFAAQRGSDNNQEGSPDISEDVALPLRVKIFREIYEFSMQKQMAQGRKWFEGLVKFAKKLSESRAIPLQEVESDLYDVVVAMDSVLELVDKFRHYPTQGLTYDEWETVYDL